MRVTYGAVILSAVLALGQEAFAWQEDRIRGPIEREASVVLRGNIHPSARIEYDRGRVDSDTVIHGLKLELSQTAAQAEALKEFLEAQRDPTGPDYRNWMTPEQFGERFGVSENDLARLVSWLQSRGFTVEQTARARNWITFSGTVAQIAETFHTELHRFEVNGERHFANSTEPSIPASLGGIIQEIRGLDDFHPKPGKPRLAAIPDFDASNGNHYLAPDDLATIYDIQPLYQAGYDGTGQTIAIAGQTDIKLADIRGFRAQFNLPPKDPQLVLMGADPGTSADDVIEADLDLEWSGGIARNATVIYVYSQDVFDSVQYAVDQNLAPVISVSYGGCETWAPASYRTVAQQANAQGITWVNASGDSGAAGCDYAVKTAANPPSPTFPADIPEVTGVGGTEFNEGSGSYWNSRNNSNLGSALSWIPEKAWNDTSAANGLVASGGGASGLYTKPWWQAGPGVPNDQARDVPDVALTASGAHDSYVIYANGGLLSVGGTSASSPSFGGIITILNQYLVSKGAASKPGLGNVNPTLYSLAQSTAGPFHDITVGDNIVPCAAGVAGCVSGSYGYKAGPGYDLATGLGSVDAWNLITKWASPPPAVGTTAAVSASPVNITQTAITQLTATVTAVSGNNTPAGSVAFSLGAIPLGSATVTGSGRTATAALQVNGNVLAVGANTITANYSGTGGFSGSTASTAVTVTAALAATSITVSANPASISQNASTTLTAVVKPASGSAAPTGTVAFTTGSTQLGTANLVASSGGATATLNVKGASLVVGANSIAAKYSGAGGFSGSSSTSTVTVMPPPVATTITATATPATILQTASTVLTAAVKAASGSTAPTGSITFLLGTSTLGVVNLSVSNSAATAVLSVKGASLMLGQNAITCVYSGATGFTASSTNVTVTVTSPAPSTTLRAAASPANIVSSGSTVVTATVQALSGSSGPTGSVTFATPKGTLGSAPVVVSGMSGTVTLTIRASSLASGVNNILATYVPSGSFGVSAASVIVNVSPAPASANLSVTASPATIGQTGSTKVTATIRAASGTICPTGSITFASGKTTLGSAVLAPSGVAAIATLTVKGSMLALGTNVINAVYAGPGFTAPAATVTVSVTTQTATSR